MEMEGSTERGEGGLAPAARCAEMGGAQVFKREGAQASGGLFGVEESISYKSLERFILIKITRNVITVRT